MRGLFGGTIRTIRLVELLDWTIGSQVSVKLYCTIRERNLKYKLRPEVRRNGKWNKNDKSKFNSMKIWDLTDAVNMKYDPEALRRVCHVRNILIASSQIVTVLSLCLWWEADVQWSECDKWHWGPVTRGGSDNVPPSSGKTPAEERGRRVIYNHLLF